MSKRIVIVGGNAGGASVAARARRLDETAQITMYEQGPHISFSNCVLPYHLSGTIPNAEKIVLMHPHQLKQQYNIDALVNHQVTAIDAEHQTVTVTNRRTLQTTTQPYDELFLAPGATPSRPQGITGITEANVWTLRNVPDVTAIMADLKARHVQQIAVIGGGLIGVEVAQHLRQADFAVTLLEAQDHLLAATLDDDLAQIVQKQCLDHGVDVRVGDAPSAVNATTVTLTSGKTIPAQAVIVATGVTPNVALAQSAGVALGITGAIKVDHNYRTNLPHVYAVGDAIEETNAITHLPTQLPLAFLAQIQARKAVDAAYGRAIRHRGVIGSQCLPVFDLQIAATGLTAAQCDQARRPYQTATVITTDRVSLLPDTHALYLKLLFAVPSGELLGAQAVGRRAVDKPIDIIATLLTQHAYVDDLLDLELAYQPEFGTAKNVVNQIGLIADNLLHQVYRQITVDQIRPLLAKQATFIDVREPGEYRAGHLLGVKNIPMSTFRQHLDEIPHDRPVYIHCASGKRSYNVVRALQHLGYTNVVNVAGSFMGLCEYEYFRDVTENRPPIVTHYRFNL